MDVARALFYQLPLPLKVPVMVCICLTQEVALLEGVALLEEVCDCPDSAWRPSSYLPEDAQSVAGFLQVKMQNSQLLLHHACLEAAMLLP